VSRSTPELSVVIPVAPDERAWPALLARLRALSIAHEIVLSAAGPPLRDAGDARIVHGRAGRAAQLNRGVAAARAPWLWLLHADSRPDPRALSAVAAYMRSEPGCVARFGWFAVEFDDQGPAPMPLNAAGANLRSRALALPFGDQAWLMSRRVFERVGGFDEGFGRGEDLEFVVRARRAGVRPEPVGAAMQTSARRYRERGWTATTLEHARLTLSQWRRARRRQSPRPP
jgi:GT2 family glycosyltransferase